MKFRVLLFFVLMFFVPRWAQAVDYYWVGGTGNWSDFANHWATTSGGAVRHPQVPTAFDNVIFDANSFTAAGQTITVDQTIVYCRNLTWTGVTNNPTLAGASANDVKVYGSLAFATGMTNSFGGEFFFESTGPGNTITMAGKSFNAYTYFQGVGGTWTFQDAFNSTSWIHLVNGTVSTNNNAVNVGAIYSTSNSARTLNLGSSTVNISGSTWAWWVSSTNFTLNAGTSLIRLNAASSPDIRNAVNLTFHNVEFTNPSATANLISCSGNTFNSVTFAGSGVISGNQTYGTLNLSAGKSYQFSAGNTQTLGTLNATGTCTSLIDIRSTTSGSQATFSKSSGTVSIGFASLKDMNATGGATFNATNAIDLGNNTGWNLSSSAARNLYWVGGNGNWTDPMHWALSSGGPGGNCPPTFQDNVFFDAASFPATGQVVTVDANASCRDMTWTGVTNTPTFTGTPNLSIFGSLTLASGMNFSFSGYTYFEATSLGKTITMAGKSFSNYAYFQGVGGGWSFMDAFASSTWIHLVNGTVTTNSNPVNVGAVYSTSNSARTLNLGASVVNISGSTWAWWVSSTNFTLNAGTSLIRLNASSSPDIRNAVNLTFYDVEFTNATTTANIISSSGNTFHSVTFFGNGAVGGGHTFQTLNLSPGKNYTFSNGATQTFGILNAIGTCTLPIDIRSVTAGSTATFSKPSGAITVDYVQLKDMTATGGATFTANNSVNLGNNAGWTINSSTARNLFWIGGTGNWTDPNHWALSSGGSGPNCPPTFQDNVFFDGNSFSAANQTVTMNAVGACRNMDWTGSTNTPTFAGTQNLSIFGSLRLISGMNFTFSGYTLFEATTTGQTITMGGRSFNGYIYFQGVGGEWTFLDAFNSSTWMHLVNGTVNTNSNLVNVGAIYSTSNSARTLNLGSSVVNISGSTWAWWVSSTNFTLNAGTSLIRLNAASSPDIRNAVNLNFYDVEFTNPSAVANLISSNGNTFHNLTFFGNGNINGSHTYDVLTLSPGKTYNLQASNTQTLITNLNANGTPGFPIEILSATPGVQTTFFKASGIICCRYLYLRDNAATGGATFYAENSSDNGNNSGWIFSSCVLPIVMAQFSASSAGNYNLLDWTLNQPIQGGSFALYRSPDGIDFVPMSQIQAQNETAFSWVDRQPHDQETWYRLDVVDASGALIESEIRWVYAGRSTSGITIFPNPTDGHTVSVVFDFAGFDDCPYEVYTLLGGLIASGKVHFDSGSSVGRISFPVPMEPGLYSLKVRSPHGVKTAKMVVKN
jgi:hypothetical protein